MICARPKNSACARLSFRGQQNMDLIRPKTWCRKVPGTSLLRILLIWRTNSRRDEAPSKTRREEISPTQMGAGGRRSVAAAVALTHSSITGYCLVGNSLLVNFENFASTPSQLVAV